MTLWLVIISVFCGCTAVENDGSSQPQTSQASVSSSHTEEIPDNKPALSGSTIFIYMCGSNLETKQGLAGKNIDELLKAEVGDDLHIVIQTGGAKTWRSHGIDATAAQRYEIKNGELRLLDTLTQLNMGEAQTLTDFLSWGQENYSADRNMLILWDHGGGSAKGVCFDENYSFDSLTLTELHTALENTKLKTKFDIIGFDACLMASVETAAVVQGFCRIYGCVRGDRAFRWLGLQGACRVICKRNRFFRSRQDDLRFLYGKMQRQRQGDLYARFLYLTCRKRII